MLIDFGEPVHTGLEPPSASASKPTADVPAAVATRSGLESTGLCVHIYRRAGEPQVDLDATNERVEAARDALRGFPAWQPNLRDHVVLVKHTACHSMEVILNTGAYDTRGVPVHHNPNVHATNWLLGALVMGGDVAGGSQWERTRALYAPTLSALSVRLKHTVSALLAGEDLSHLAITTELTPHGASRAVEALVHADGSSEWIRDGEMQELLRADVVTEEHVRTAAAAYTATPPTDGLFPGLFDDVAAVTMRLTIDARTSAMLSDRFAGMHEQSRNADPVHGDGRTTYDPLPYGQDDLLWGQTLSELLWLGGADLHPDERRRDASADAALLVDASQLKPPNAPAHFATSRWQSPEAREYVVWRATVSPMQRDACV